MPALTAQVLFFIVFTHHKKIHVAKNYAHFF